MEPVLFILLVTIAGSSGLAFFQQCDLSSCNTVSYEVFQRTMREFPPNEEELREICPPLKEGVECALSLIQECTGESLEEMRASDNETVAKLMSTVQNVFSLVRDVCDEESQIGRDFRESAPCLKKVFSERNFDCIHESHGLYEAFRFPEGSDANEILAKYEKGLPEEMRCLTVAYDMACQLKGIQKTCGSVARDVLLQVAKRAKMLSMGICTEEDLLTLRGQFLEFLEEQGEHRAFFANAFEFRKRK